MNKLFKNIILRFSALLCLLVIGFTAYSQDGNNGIREATNKVKGYFDAGTDLMYAIGAVVGIIGAIKVFNKWNAGEPDTSKVAAAWFGSCIFLVVVATVLKSFFGI
ncbi:DUF4134 domain-containing protein [Pedobacter sp. Du54]|uniref:DUF4134 domain-containing protein n=1 Tax=Pedobacter anseongensis TaxID=3133439 RepID=UPI003099B6C9